MQRSVLVFVAAACLAVGAPAFADAPPPDAAKVRTAAAQFEAGALAYKKGAFEEAASAFEAADASVRSPKPLRLAIKAHDKAGQGSRAATLAALALARYPDDAETADLAKKTIAALSPKLHALRIQCVSPCVLAVGTRAIQGDPNTRWTLYLDPGAVDVSASFFGGASAHAKIDAKAGGSSDVRLEPAEDAPAKSAATPAPTDAPTAESTPALEAPAAETPVRDAATPKKGLSPAFFVTGLVATAALGGVTIWSGIDTKNNPGPDAVRAACAGKGEDCPEYAAGRAHQTRTNVLLGATIGVGVVTAVLGAFTRWGGSSSAPAKSGSSHKGTEISAGGWVDHGGGVALSGRF
jgi:hypothetical protein